jgi:N-acetylmuramoyl-L-alanine amidase
MVVVHYTGMTSAAAALARLCDPEAKVSAHYVIEEDGSVWALVEEERRAWHAGVSAWRGQREVNGVSIGVELVNPGHAWGYRDFPQAQIAALISLLDDVRARWTIADRDIVGHSDVAPARKEDPGEKFPWPQLHAAGHGIHHQALSPAPGPPLELGAEGVGVFILQAGLTRLGYDSPPSGVYDRDTALIVTAFQRHWRPARVDGVADGGTRAALTALLRGLAEADA